MTRWFESAWQKENKLEEGFEDENLHGTPASEDSEMVDSSINDAVTNLIHAPNYSAALNTFNDHFRELSQIIPYGGGGFEAWWTSGEGEEDSVQSPHMPITLEDIMRLKENHELYGEISGLLSNIFYNGRKIAMDDDALSFVISEGIKQNVGMEGPELMEGWFGEDVDADMIDLAVQRPNVMRMVVKAAKESIGR